MVECAPFQGWRFSPAAGELAKLIAPPYDVIAPDEEQALYDAHPHNIIRLIRSRATPEDTATSNAYTRARALLEEWCAAGVLARDPRPSCYLYEQEVVVDHRPRRRLSVIGLTKLVEPNAGELFFHEHTFAAPREDRLRLLQAVEANLSLISSLFSEPAQGPVMALLRAWAAERPPDAVVPFRQETHRFWCVTKPSQLKALQAAMRDRTLVIADGHHRYEAAWLNRERSPWVMLCCGWLEDPELVILPIHRIVRRRPPGTGVSVVERLDRCGEVTKLKSVSELLRRLARADGQGLFGYYTDRAVWLVRTDPDLCAEVRRHSPALGGLDVAILHHGIFPRLFGATLADLVVLDYTPDAATACGAVDRGEAEGAWLLRPMQGALIAQLARQRVLLPQKSTYFYPKLLTGLVLHRFDTAR